MAKLISSVLRNPSTMFALEGQVSLDAGSVVGSPLNFAEPWKRTDDGGVLELVLVEES
jgi:hypothetical protein